MSRALRLAADLTLPLDAVTQKLAFLGRTGSGKTYAATKLAEAMLDRDAQIVAIDGVGLWYGLRLAADGKSTGISIPVFGGLHGDVPLESTAGKMLADLVVDRGISAVLDVSQFEHDTDRARFAGDFAARLFHRKKAAPSALHVFLEECQDFVPQNPARGEEQMLHAFNRLIRQGRNFGIGATLISQRPQDVSKKALNQAECVFAFQLTGPHERKAVDGWITDKGLDTDIAADLPKLRTGQAHVWSPSWLEISRVVSIEKKRTFDASATPEVGKRVTARDLAPIELEQLRKDMAATIERAKADDPRELRKKIAELERQLKAKPAAATAPKVERVEVPVFTKGELAQLASLDERLGLMTGKVDDIRARVSGLVQVAAQRATPPAVERPTPSSAPRRDVEIRRPPIRTPVARSTPTSGNGRALAAAGDPDVGGGGLRRMMIALAQRPKGLTQRQLGLRAGLSSRSGTFSTYLGRARNAGWIEGRSELRITEAGIAALGTYEPLPEGQELLDYWLRELGESGAARMLRALAGAYPEPMTQDQLGEAASISSRSGTFSTYLGRLRGLELVEGRGELRASEELFS